MTTYLVRVRVRVRVGVGVGVRVRVRVRVRFGLGLGLGLGFGLGFGLGLGLGGSILTTYGNRPRPVGSDGSGSLSACTLPAAQGRSPPRQQTTRSETSKRSLGEATLARCSLACR